MTATVAPRGSHASSPPALGIRYKQRKLLKPSAIIERNDKADDASWASEFKIDLTIRGRMFGLRVARSTDWPVSSR